MVEDCLDKITSDLELLVLRKKGLNFTVTFGKVPVIHIVIASESVELEKSKGGDFRSRVPKIVSRNKQVKEQNVRGKEYKDVGS